MWSKNIFRTPPVVYWKIKEDNHFHIFDSRCISYLYPYDIIVQNDLTNKCPKMFHDGCRVERLAARRTQHLELNQDYTSLMVCAVSVDDDNVE